MMNQMTQAQNAQQNNRDQGGRYATKIHDEATFAAPTIPAGQSRLQRLTTEAETSAAAMIAASQRHAYIAGQLLLEQIREVRPDAFGLGIDDLGDGPPVSRVFNQAGEVIHADEDPAADGDLVDLINSERELTADAVSPNGYKSTVRYDPGGDDAPVPVLVPDVSGSVTTQVHHIGIVGRVSSGGVQMMETYASEELRDAALVDMAQARMEEDGDDDTVEDAEAALEWLRNNDYGADYWIDS